MDNLQEKLISGSGIVFGKQYCLKNNMKHDGIIYILRDCGFDDDNGGYPTTEYAPAILFDKHEEPESIFHLFENDLSEFMDCRVIKKAPPKRG